MHDAPTECPTEELSWPSAVPHGPIGAPMKCGECAAQTPAAPRPDALRVQPELSDRARGRREAAPLPESTRPAGRSPATPAHSVVLWLGLAGAGLLAMLLTLPLGFLAVAAALSPPHPAPFPLLSTGWVEIPEAFEAPEGVSASSPFACSPPPGAPPSMLHHPERAHLQYVADDFVRLGSPQDPRTDADYDSTRCIYMLYFEPGGQLTDAQVGPVDCPAAVRTAMCAAAWDFQREPDPAGRPVLSLLPLDALP